MALNVVQFLVISYLYLDFAKKISIVQVVRVQELFATTVDFILTVGTRYERGGTFYNIYFLLGKDLLPPACLSVYYSSQTKMITDYAAHGGVPVNVYVELVFLKID